MKPIMTIIDAATQETVVREMNDEEYAQYLIDQENFELELVQINAKKAEEDAAKAALHEKLAELGITEELIEVIKKL